MIFFFKISENFLQEKVLFFWIWHLVSQHQPKIKTLTIHIKSHSHLSNTHRIKANVKVFRKILRNLNFSNLIYFVFSLNKLIPQQVSVVVLEVIFELFFSMSIHIFKYILNSFIRHTWQFSCFYKNVCKVL